MRSSDKGRNWTTIYSVSAMSPIFQLAVDSLGIFAVTEKEFLRSGDNGAHWTTSPLPISHGANGLLVIKGGSLFLTDAVTLFRSPDSGHTWQPSLALGDSMWLSGLSRVGNSLYVARVVDDFRMTHLRSGDDGASWQEISRYFNGYQGRQIHQFIALGNDLFAATFTGLFRSSDNGLTWSPQNFGMSRSYFKSLVTMPDGEWLGLERFGLFQSRDSGANWTMGGRHGGRVPAATGTVPFRERLPAIHLLPTARYFPVVGRGQALEIPGRCPFRFGRGPNGLLGSRSLHPGG